MTTFEKISPTEAQVKTLYELLSDRHHKISHAAMPSFDDHSDFVLKNPYRFWFLIKLNGAYVGNFYVTDENMIGINIADNAIAACLNPIFDKIAADIPPQPAIKSVRAGRFCINVPPSNTRLIAALEAAHFPLVQTTFGLPDRKKQT